MPYAFSGRKLLGFVAPSFGHSLDWTSLITDNARVRVQKLTFHKLSKNYLPAYQVRDRDGTEGLIVDLLLFNLQGVQNVFLFNKLRKSASISCLHLLQILFTILLRHTPYLMCVKNFKSASSVKRR